MCVRGRRVLFCLVFSYNIGSIPSKEPSKKKNLNQMSNLSHFWWCADFCSTAFYSTVWSAQKDGGRLYRVFGIVVGFCRRTVAYNFCGGGGGGTVYTILRAVSHISILFSLLLGGRSRGRGGGGYHAYEKLVVGSCSYTRRYETDEATCGPQKKTFSFFELNTTQKCTE